MNSTTNKIYVQPDNSALLVCPECGFQKRFPTSSYRHKAHKIKVRCKCSNQFEILLEFRRYFRKTVNLEGECKIIPGDNVSKNIKITDLSMGGTCIQVDSTELFKMGAKGIMMFTMDNRHKTKIVKNFTVKAITGKRVHCEFCKDKEYQRELGFYLRA